MSGNTNPNQIGDVQNIRAHFTSLTPEAEAVIQSLVDVVAPLVLEAPDDSTVPLTVAGAADAGQTANLQEWYESLSGIQIAYLTHLGALFLLGTQAKFSIDAEEFGRVLTLGVNQFGGGSGSMGVEAVNAGQLWLVCDSGVIRLRVSSQIGAELESSAVARDTFLKIFDVDNNQLERVSVGAADSGGTGFKCLRIPN